MFKKLADLTACKGFAQICASLEPPALLGPLARGSKLFSPLFVHLTVTS
jgi:hypothetical protein